MSARPLDRRQIRRAFAGAAARLAGHDVVYREVEASLLDRLVFYLDTPALIVDLGAGHGHGAAALKKRWPRATVIAIDSAPAMLREAAHQRSWWRPFRRIAADAYALPLADASVDVLYSNLCFQWCDDPLALFRECARVLKPGGFLAFTTLGPDSLETLRTACAAVDATPRVGRFLDMHDLGDAMVAAGLYDPVVDVERYTVTYPTPRALLDELKALGATNADPQRRRGLSGKERFARLLATLDDQRVDGRIAETVEVVSAHAWGLKPGQMPRLPLGGRYAEETAADLVKKWPRKPG